MSAQIITSNGKPAFAVLPIAEYERLLTLAEDRIDINEARRVSARIASGEEETLPADFVDVPTPPPPGSCRFSPATRQSLTLCTTLPAGCRQPSVAQADR
jgi:hypothetical protein